MVIFIVNSFYYFLNRRDCSNKFNPIKHFLINFRVSKPLEIIKINSKISVHFQELYELTKVSNKKIFEAHMVLI